MKSASFQGRDAPDVPERTLLALNITKITPHYGHYLRVYPRDSPYLRLIDPNGVVDPGQRTPTFLTFRRSYREDISS